MLTWEYPPHLVGGMGAHVSELVPALADQNVDLTVLTPRWKGGAPTERVHPRAVVYRLEPPTPGISNYLADANHTNLTIQDAVHRLWQTEGGFDLIHAHDWLVSFAAEALKKFYRVPLVATIHATERGRGRGELRGEVAEAINGAEWWLCYESWRLIATSHFMANELATFFQVPRDKTQVIPNGVNPARFGGRSAQELARFRRDWVTDGQALVFYIGRIQHEKGVENLVRAARVLVERSESVKFVLAGTGALLEPLRQWVAAQGLQDHIVLTGYISDTDRDLFLECADVAVFPSLYEPFGIVALEAMAAHCPVIVTDVGGLGEVVDDGVTGIRIPPDNLDALVNGIANVIHDPAAAHARAERAYGVVCHQYSWDHIARDTVNLYENVLAERAVCEWQ